MASLVARPYHHVEPTHRRRHGVRRMTAIQRSIGSARRRLFLQDWLTGFGRALVLGLLLAALLLLADRLFALLVPLRGYVLPVGVPLLVAPVVAWRRRPDRAEAAALLDQRLDLKDRLATALYAEQLGDHPFARQVLAEAEQAAGQAPVSAAIGIRLRRVWAYVPVVLALLLLLAWLLPQWDLAGLQRGRDRAAAEQAEAADAREELGQVVATVKRIEQQPEDAGTPEALESIGQLARLSDKQLNSPKLRRDAAAKLSDAAEKLDKQIEQQQRESDAVKNMLSRIDGRQVGPADELVNALRRGSFDAAADALDSAVESAGEMSPEQRKKLTDQLERVAQDLKKESQRQAQKQQQAQEKADKTLEAAGLDKQQIEQLKKENYDPKAVKEALQKQGTDQQQAERTARQVQKQQQQRQQSGECGKCSGGLASALGRLTQTLSDSAKQGSPDEQGRESTPSQSEQQGTASPKEGQPSGQGSGAKPGEADPTGQPSAQGGNKPGTSAGAPSGDQSPQPKPGEQDTATSSDETRRAAGGTDKPTADDPTRRAADDVKRQLDQMAKAQRQLDQLRQSQEQMRRAMRKMTGASRGGASSGGKQWGRGPGHAPLGAPKRIKPDKTHAVGVKRKPGEIAKGIVSWTSDGKIAKGEAQIEFDRTVTAARSEAESALTEDRVPKRYHGPVQKYFKLGDDEAAEPAAQE